jgi:hypothetical protein
MMAGERDDPYYFLNGTSFGMNFSNIACWSQADSNVNKPSSAKNGLSMCMIFSG